VAWEEGCTIVRQVVEGLRSGLAVRDANMIQSLLSRSQLLAIARVFAEQAVRTIGDLMSEANPLARAVAVAAIGTRRSDPGPELALALVDPSPLVCARAYRTTGQLGRQDLMAQLRPGLTCPSDGACCSSI
jgi:hypothetical protein